MILPLFRNANSATDPIIGRNPSYLLALPMQRVSLCQASIQGRASSPLLSRTPLKSELHPF